MQDGVAGIEEIYSQFLLAAPSSADNNSTQQPAKVDSCKKYISLASFIKKYMVNFLYKCCA